MQHPPSICPRVPTPLFSAQMGRRTMSSLPEMHAPSKGHLWLQAWTRSTLQMRTLWPCTSPALLPCCQTNPGHESRGQRQPLSRGSALLTEKSSTTRLAPLRFPGKGSNPAPPKRLGSMLTYVCRACPLHSPKAGTCISRQPAGSISSHKARTSLLQKDVTGPAVLGTY